MADKKTDVEAVEEGRACSNANAVEGTYSNQVVMESGGATGMGDPGYIENDDVKDSMAEGYF